MNCPVCNQLAKKTGQTETMVSYVGTKFKDEKGEHNHDENCVIQRFRCPAGHQFSLWEQRTCPVCDWRGKEECFCHPPGVKITTGPLGFDSSNFEVR